MNKYYQNKHAFMANKNNTIRNKYRYLIIGGAPKSGTTSLYRYLSDHPNVCPSNRKETYFFAREYDLNNVCKTNETRKDFEEYFSHCNSTQKLRIEGTPYTLYCKDIAEKIHVLLPNASLLFILRDPIKRLISDYRFHYQRNHPSTRGSIDDFFEWQYNIRGIIPNLIKCGCYIVYLRSFISVFGYDKVHTLIFEDFFTNVHDSMQSLSKRLNIDDTFYESYRPSIHNPTLNYRSSWMNRTIINIEPIIASIRARIIHLPIIHRLFEDTLMVGKTFYHKVNNQNTINMGVFPNDKISYLKDYYQPYNQALSEELGISLPWGK